jgi:hypothetical protein
MSPYARFEKVLAVSAALLCATTAAYAQNNNKDKNATDVNVVNPLRVLIPGTPFQVFAQNVNESATPVETGLGSPIAGTTLAVSTITVTNLQSNTTSVFIALYGGTCNFNSPSPVGAVTLIRSINLLALPARQTVHLAYPIPLLLDKANCIYVQVPGSQNVTWSASGFYY